jgi:hypothetical protein
LVVASIHLGFSLPLAPLEVRREGGREGGKKKPADLLILTPLSSLPPSLPPSLVGAHPAHARGLSLWSRCLLRPLFSSTGCHRGGAKKGV